MPSLRAILASQETHPWPSTSGTVTAVVVVLTVVVAALCTAGLYFLHKHSLQYAKSTSRGRLQHSMSFLYVVLMFCSILEAAITAWLLAQYIHQDRFPSVGTRDGLRIALFAACWTLVGASLQIFFLLRPSQWIRKRPIPAVISQAVWTILTWAIWVAATRTVQRASPLLSARSNCAGADYCLQLHAALVLTLSAILLLILGMSILVWAMWRLSRRVTKPRRR